MNIGGKTLSPEIGLIISGLQQTIDNERAECARVIGLLRSARELVWHHHADGIMKPDICPLCSGENREINWLFEQMKEVIE